MGDLQYAEARSALEAAEKRQGNDRETLLRIYELQGIVFATLNDATKAGKAFQRLLVMDPEHKLSGDYPPRVMTPFYEARGRASEMGRLEFKALPAAVADKRVQQLAVEIANDPLKMVKKVKFHTRSDGGAWSETPGDLSGKTASISVDAAKVEWWADGIGDREGVVAQVGSEAQPKVDLGAPVVARAEPTEGGPLTPPPSAASPGEGITQEGPGMSGLRTGGIVMGVVGVIGLGVGGVFGFLSGQAKNKIDTATTNAQGQVTSLTQKDAYALDSTVRTDAIIANVGFVLGGALVGAGVLLFLLGGNSGSTTVSLSPTLNGAMFSGTW